MGTDIPGIARGFATGSGAIDDECVDEAVAVIVVRREVHQRISRDPGVAGYVLGARVTVGRPEVVRRGRRQYAELRTRRRYRESIG